MHVDNVVGKVGLPAERPPQHQRNVFLWKQLRNRRRLSRTAAEVALQDSHARAGGRWQLDLDSERALGESKRESATTVCISPRCREISTHQPRPTDLNTGVSGPFTGGLPRIGFGGYFFPGLGGFKWPKFQGPDSITQFVDHVSYTAGKHSLKIRRRTALQQSDECGVRQRARQHHVSGRCRESGPRLTTLLRLPVR